MKPEIHSLKKKQKPNSDKSESESKPKSERSNSSDSAQSTHTSSLKSNQKLSPKPKSSKQAKQKDTHQSDNKKPADFFQAVGVIKGKVSILSENQGTVTIAGKSYRLFLPHYRAKAIRILKETIEKRGNVEQTLVVYPEFVHYPNEDPFYQLSFHLVTVIQQKNTDILNDLNEMEFNLAGLWQFIPDFSLPCVSVFKNLTRRRSHHFKHKNPVAKVRLLQPFHLPLLWEQPLVEPKPVNSEPTSAMFIRVKAQFCPEKDIFHFISLLRSPLEETPPFLQLSEQDLEAAKQQKQEKKKLKQEGLTGTALAERLGVSGSTVAAHSKKEKEAFMAWTSHKDPRGWAWERRDQQGDTSQKTSKPRYFVVSD